jgi:hypothetical protein
MRGILWPYAGKIPSSGGARKGKGGGRQTNSIFQVKPSWSGPWGRGTQGHSFLHGNHVKIDYEVGGEGGITLLNQTNHFVSEIV